MNLYDLILSLKVKKFIVTLWSRGSETFTQHEFVEQDFDVDIIHNEWLCEIVSDCDFCYIGVQDGLINIGVEWK